MDGTGCRLNPETVNGKHFFCIHLPDGIAAMINASRLHHVFTSIPGLFVKPPRISRLCALYVMLDTAAISSRFKGTLPEKVDQARRLL